MIIKPTPLTINQLFGSANEQYVIPAYQRRYSWREKQLSDLWKDIEVIEGSDNHLFGSIVCLTAPHNANINQLEVVDGQQRLTTISIVLHCLHERLLREGDAAEIGELERLLTARTSDRQKVAKVELDSLDAAEFHSHIRRENEPAQNPALEEAFMKCREWVGKPSLEALRGFIYRLINQALVIRLDVFEAKDAFKLFETINNRGLRLSPTDIIKNFILGNSARFGKSELDYARKKWGQLVVSLDGVNAEAFFRHYLCAQLCRRITAAHVIGYFKKMFMLEVQEAAKLPEIRWYRDEPEMISEDEDADDSEEGEEGDEIDFEMSGVRPRIPFKDFLEKLINNARHYRELALGSTGNPRFDRRLRNLRMIKASQTYGFLTAMRIGGCSDEDFESILKLTEAFLIRRHICRERGNDNEKAFASLCGTDPLNPLAAVINTYRELSPPDERFRTDFAEVRFRLLDRARYCLEQIELQRYGRHPELHLEGPDLVHVEHIIPQNLRNRKVKEEYGDWATYLGPKAETYFPKWISLIGNLTLLAGPLNIASSNNPYERKKPAYKDSAIRMTNTLPDEYKEFRFNQVKKRSQELAKLAVEIWPIPQ